MDCGTLIILHMCSNVFLHIDAFSDSKCWKFRSVWFFARSPIVQLRTMGTLWCFLGRLRNVPFSVCEAPNRPINTRHTPTPPSQCVPRKSVSGWAQCVCENGTTRKIGKQKNRFSGARTADSAWNMQSSWPDRFSRCRECRGTRTRSINISFLTK